jgi:methylene-tetrahydromethanopterin dehydrogenase
MAKRSILHMLDPMPNNSPFDVNMALDAGFDVLVPYSNIKLDNVYGLTQDAIFSRSPSGVKRTGIFIGGRDLGLAMDMLNACKQAMVPPFEVSVFADPSGAFTTAAALVVCAEKELKSKHNKELNQCSAVILGGTGPVGIATGIIASLAGADVTLTDHLSLETAQDISKAYNRRFNCTLKGALANSEADKAGLIANTDIIFCTAKAGVRVLSADVLKQATKLKVAADINAVPPSGIEGVKNKDCGAPLIHAESSQGAVGIGALAVGNVKFQLQHDLLKAMLESGQQPLFIDFRYAFNKVREMQLGTSKN